MSHRINGLFVLALFLASACGAAVGGSSSSGGSGGTGGGTGGSSLINCGNRSCGTGETTQACPVDCPAPEGPSGEPYNLGALPAELSALQWPTTPLITREVEVASATAFNQAAATAGTRIRVTQSFTDTVNLAGRSNLEIVMDDGVSIGRVLMGSGSRRIHFNGGEYTEGISMDPANGVVGSINQDILIERAILGSSTGSTIQARGHRIAIIGCMTDADRFSVYSGEMLPLFSEDIIIAGNFFVSRGAEATVRLESVVRGVTVENVMINGDDTAISKHNYRVHEQSHLVFAARNLLIYSGTMSGTLPEEGDDVGTIWFNDNTIYLHPTRTDLFHPRYPYIDYVQATGNVAYTDSFHRTSSCANFYCYGVEASLPQATPPAGWDIGDNELFPYEEPPYEP